jgi:osmotically-inducible protein OsmY
MINQWSSRFRRFELALVSGRVDIAVYAGHVVLVGVVNSRANVQKFIADANSVNGVVSVTSYIQTV